MAFQGLTQPSIYFPATPSFNWAQFLPPVDEAEALPPAPVEASIARPFNIDPITYNKYLSIKYPATIAATYFVTVTLLNRFNVSRKHKAWRVSKTRPFFWFVIAHNVFLAVYSAWTCFFMVSALARTLPGFRNPQGVAGIVDSMCKMSGPRGYGSAVTYNPFTASWGSLNRNVALGTNELPDTSDVGRLWNEGLGYYGWFFYLSKFYEVIDTLIILAKGKRSSTLQTYHHAGAMFCMWAGIRFMSPPIWMFVLVNSGIHALMYTYYTLSALSIKVPTTFKRSLTTLQITQFLVGFTYAVIHLFVAYEVPYEKPFSFFRNVSSDLPSVTSSLAEVATASAGAWLKKLALRAAGEEGAAEQVHNEHGQNFGNQLLQNVNKNSARNPGEEIRYKWETSKTHCIDTPGQSFAILLNALYLLPLTVLFVRFFIKSYSKRYRRNSIPQDLKDNILPSGLSAARNVNREVHEALSGAHSDFEFAVDSDAVDGTDLRKVAESTKTAMKKATEDFKNEAQSLGKQAKDAGENTMTKSQTLAKDLKEATQDNVSSGQETPKSTGPETPKKKKNKNKNKKADPKPEPEKTEAEKRDEKQGETYAEAALKGANSAAGDNSDSKDVKKEEQPEDEEERIARELVERAYAAANSASASVSDDAASETVSIFQKDETSYEVNIDETTTKEEKKIENEMQPDAGKSK